MGSKSAHSADQVCAATGHDHKSLGGNHGCTRAFQVFVLHLLCSPFASA